MEADFVEYQDFRRNWMLWVVVTLVVIFTVLPVRMMYLEAGKLEKMDFGILMLLLSCAIMPVLFIMCLKMTTVITDQGLTFKYYPFVSMQIKWGEIKSAELVDYGFVGGWGIRLGSKYGTVFNTSGREGIAFELTSGKKFLIGTRRGQDFHDTIHWYLSTKVTYDEPMEALFKSSPWVE